MNESKRILLLIVCLVLIISSFLIYFLVIDNTNQNLDKTSQIVNPASKNCITLGGELEIRIDENGGQYGICKKDGKECGEWLLYRKECNFE